MTPMQHREAKYNPKTRKATYNDIAHYGEVVRGAKIDNNSSTALKQRLDDPKSTSAASAILSSVRHSKK